jgi:ADP-ribosylglycohydrolase
MLGSCLGCRAGLDERGTDRGAFAIVLAVRAATNGEVSLEQIASHLPDTSVRDGLLAYAALPAGTSVGEAASRFGSSGYVVESVPVALFAASQLTGLGFAGILEQLIAAGGDTDSNASLAGQIAGTTLGFDRLPGELLERLPGSEMVLRIARDFAEQVASSSDVGRGVL